MTIKLKCEGGDISEKVVMKQEKKLKQRAKKMEEEEDLLNCKSYGDLYSHRF